MSDIGAGRALAAFAALGSAGIHVAAGVDHYSSWWISGVFFYAAAVYQAVWGLSVLRTGGRPTMLLGLAGNAGILAVWAVSRTAGMPVGPHAGVPEHIGQAGVTSAVLEALVCLVALWHLVRPEGRGFASTARAVLLAGAMSAAVTAAAVPAGQAALSHGHGADSAGHGDEHGDGHGDDHGDGHGDGHDHGGTDDQPEPSGSPSAPSAPASPAPDPSAGGSEPADPPEPEEPDHGDDGHGDHAH
ncbi:hypothetical protein HOY81_07010 [Streptomyces sp. JJ36]|nr:hypothetical protein [Streptomyces sp. JJ36]